MKSGTAFEIFVRRILINVGFNEVKNDDKYIFKGTAGQMIQGLGEAHNADALLEPPVQIPFFNKVRLLVECKDHEKPVGLGVVRDALGLREDVNNYNLVDNIELQNRRSQRRRGVLNYYERYSYQIAIASTSGFTIQAQNFAATHRIPLIDFDKMNFVDYLRNALHYVSDNDGEQEERIIRFADDIGKKMAVAITNSGQMLFLHREIGETTTFSGDYNLFWVGKELPWKMTSGECQYNFGLPDGIMRQWLDNATDEIKKRKSAIYCKEEYLSHMVVYYRKHGKPEISMISINKNRLEEAKKRLMENELEE